MDQEEENRKYSQSITAYVKEKAMSQKWFIAFCAVWITLIFVIRCSYFLSAV